MTVYGLPIFLEDKTGKLTGTEFLDIHERMRFIYRCTAPSAYIIFDANGRPLIALDFSQKCLSFASAAGSFVEMKKWLAPVKASSKARKFRASDSQEYLWTWRTKENQEWTCTNANGYLVAYYSLKVPGEPHYDSSSGCSLTIDEAFGHLAPEFLGSLMIMRNLAQCGW